MSFIDHDQKRRLDFIARLGLGIHVEILGRWLKGLFLRHSKMGGRQMSGEENILPSLEARLACRNGMASTTAGVANGFVQGNLAILPENLAPAFHRFCQLNPKPCSILRMSD